MQATADIDQCFSTGDGCLELCMFTPGVYPVACDLGYLIKIYFSNPCNNTQNVCDPPDKAKP